MALLVSDRDLDWKSLTRDERRDERRQNIAPGQRVGQEYMHMYMFMSCCHSRCRSSTSVKSLQLRDRRHAHSAAALSPREASARAAASARASSFPTARGGPSAGSRTTRCTKESSASARRCCGSGCSRGRGWVSCATIAPSGSSPSRHASLAAPPPSQPRSPAASL